MLCDIIDRQAAQIKAWRHLQEQSKAKDELLREAKATIVQLKNDACVLRGQLEHQE
jgi:hypothetical protein